VSTVASGNAAGSSVSRGGHHVGFGRVRALDADLSVGAFGNGVPESIGIAGVGDERRDDRGTDHAVDPAAEGGVDVSRVRRRRRTGVLLLESVRARFLVERPQSDAFDPAAGRANPFIDARGGVGVVTTTGSSASLSAV